MVYRPRVGTLKRAAAVEPRGLQQDVHRVLIYTHLHLHLGHLADAFIQSGLQ